VVNPNAKEIPMGWSTLYLVIAILAGIIGIWNLAQQRNIFLSLTGILWFLAILFEQYIPRVSGYHLVSGLPALGTIFLYVIIPIFVILAFFTSSGRR
jgi:hypothetical protein